MSRYALLLSAAFAISLSAPANADVWVDDKLRSMTLQAPGLATTEITAQGHDAATAAVFFKSICLSGKLDKISISDNIAKNDWGFAFVDKIMPFNDPVNIGGFYAPDAVLNVSENLFFNKVPQCNLIIRTVEPYERAVAIDALSQAIGSPPTNSMDAMKKGKPNKSYQPKWTIDDASGKSFTVTVRASVVDPSATHFAALQEVSKK